MNLTLDECKKDSHTHKTSKLEVCSQDIPFAGLPTELSGKTAVQLSDFHRGCGNTDEIIQEAIHTANALEPDYIFVTGDFVDHKKQDILPIVRMVSGLRARRGVFATLGNHDHRGDPLLLESALEAAGITMLTNRALELEPGLWLAGVDDLYEGEPNLEASLQKVPPDVACILLSHHPGALDLVTKERPLTILAGHTHGGQIVLPFPTPEMVCWQHLRTRYVHGWFQRGAVRLYVNRGIGVTGWGPLARRFRCPPEVTWFRFVSMEEPENAMTYVVGQNR
jgi:predicted MPP superfamily phosphohydrolase